MGKSLEVKSTVTVFLSALTVKTSAGKELESVLAVTVVLTRPSYLVVPYGQPAGLLT